MHLLCPSEAQRAKEGQIAGIRPSRTVLEGKYLQLISLTQNALMYV